MIHKTLSNPRGTVHYWTAGGGDQSIVFTHGATMDHGMFLSQVDHFAPDYRVVSWDVPAHGRSRPYRDFSLQTAAADLVAIMDAEGMGTAHLVGQSMGGYVSQIAAAAHPARVLTLTALGSSPVQRAYYSGLDRWLLSVTPSLLGLYPYGYLVNLIANQIAVTAEARAYALETLKTYTKAEIAAIMAAVYAGVVKYDHPVLACPILVAYGDRDRTGKVRAYCDRWATNEHRELAVIPNAAHNANMDNPAAFNEILAAFLARHPA